MTEIDLSPWLTKPQAAEAIGVSTKQVERLQQAGKLEQRSRPQERGPHVAVYNPDDVARIAAERHPAAAPFVLPAVLTPTGNGNRPPTVPGESTALTIADAPPGGVDDVRALVALALRTVLSQTSQTSALFLSIPEASTYTGLTQAFIRRMIKLGTLTAIKDRCWKIRRKDLEQF